jgi:short-subunit dehydrogenase
LDIAFLVLNAGWAIMGQFEIMEPEEMEMIINTEALHPVYLLKSVLSQLISRKKKSCVILTGSGIGSAPMPGFLAHSMSKVFTHFLGNGLSLELKDRLEILTFECGQVHTKSNLNNNSKDPFTVTPQ